MISFKVGSAVEASKFQGEWNPQCHWVITPEEPIEADFVQSVLNKYGPHVTAYSIMPWGSSQVVELQFADDALGRQCNQEYVKGWRKGGQVAVKKKAGIKKATKRLLRNRMYVLPDGTEFFYYARWDSHGNLAGKIINELSTTEDGMVRLENRIVHRSVVEQGTLVPYGQERFWLSQETTEKERRAVLEATCRLRAKNGPCGPGDCYYLEPMAKVCNALRPMDIGTIYSAIQHLEDVDGFLVREEEGIAVTNEGWRAWSGWKDEFFLGIVFSESGQDWPDWETDREYWRTINPDVQQKLEAEFASIVQEEQEKERRAIENPGSEDDDQ